MLRKIFGFRIPFVAVFFLLAIAIGASLFFANAFRTNVVRYDVFLAGNTTTTPQPFGYGSWPALANADFFRQVKKQFIAERATFIEADLSAMRLRVYKKGETEIDAPILSKGREGSWWETPAGLYKIETKTKNHFSSFGRVYQPWSMAFQGNFFIHGWPYYPDGTPVKSTYSGGCVRLSTEDAKKVFETAAVGTPVLVYAEDFTTDDFRHELKIPPIGAKSFLVADLRSNYVFAERAASETRPIASLTKLMTALVAIEYMNIERELIVPPGALVSTTRPRLRAGQRFTVYDLLYPLLLESSNEAAEALAAVLGRERFIGLMNEKARSLGMVRTRFTDPSGKDPKNVSSVEDLFLLAKYLYHNRSFILRLTTGKLDGGLYGPPKFRDLKNYNVFETHPDFVGGKIGKTDEAAETILSIFRVPFNRSERPVVIIVLGSDQNGEDANTLLSWLTSRY